MAQIFKTTKQEKHWHLVYIDVAQDRFVTSVDKNHDHPVALIADPEGNPVIVIGEADGHKHYLEDVGEALPAEPEKKSDIEAVEKGLQLFKRAATLEEKPRERARESMKFFKGDQWEPAVKQALKAKKRACQTLNFVASQVDVLSGLARQNRLDPRALPVEGSDEGVADIATAGLLWVSKRTRLPVQEIRVFDDGVITGRGLFHICLTQNKNPQGDIVIERFPWADGYFGQHEELDGSDATHAHKAKWLSIAEAKAKYPEKADEIKQLVDISTNYPREATQELEQVEGSRTYIDTKYASENEIYDKNHNRIRLIEHEIKEFRTANIVLNGDMSLQQELTDSEAAKAKTIEDLQVLELPRERIRIIVTVGTSLIRDFYPDRPYDGFSLVPYYIYKYDGTEGWNGKVEFMKDNQREINKRSSQIIDAANTTLSPGFFHEPETFTSEKQKRDFQQNASTPGHNQEINDVTRPPIPKQNPNFPRELFTIQETNTQNMQSITNINPGLAGNQSQYQSGKANLVQRQAGLVGNERVFDNFILAKQTVFQKAFLMLQEYFTPERLARIVLSEASDPNRLSDLMIGQQPLPQQRTPEEDQAALQNIIKLLETKDMAEYDIVIGEQPLSPTMKEATLRMWLEAKQMGVPVPPELLVELSSLPNKGKWAKVMAALAQQQMEMEKLKFQTEMQKAGRLPPGGSAQTNNIQGGSQQ